MPKRNHAKTEARFLEKANDASVRRHFLDGNSNYRSLYLSVRGYLGLDQPMIAARRSKAFSIAEAFGLLAFLIAPLAAAQISLPAGVHVQFGTVSSRTGGADGGQIVAETPSGEVLVAGFADSAWTDTGGTPPKPMLAAFSRDGTQLWYRAYDLRSWEVVALNADGPAPKILLWRRAHYPHEIRSEVLSESEVTGRVELWEVDAEGRLDELVLGFEHERQGYAADSTPEGFTIWMTSNDFAATTDPRMRYSVRTYDWTGNVSAEAAEFSARWGELMSVYADGAVYRDVESTNDSVIQKLRFLSRDGETVGQVNVPDCGRCRHFDVSRRGDTFEVLASSDGDSPPWQGLRLLEIDFSAGRTEIVKEYPELRGAELAFNPMPDGNTLLTGHDARKPLLASLSPSRELRWMKRFESGQPFATVTHAIELDDGSLALTGSTSPGPGVFVQTNSDALLLISDAEGHYLNQFGQCIVADGSLAEDLYRLRQKGFLIRLHGLNGVLETSNRVVPASSLPRRVAIPSDCEDRTELVLQSYVHELLEHLSGNSPSSTNSSENVVLVPLSDQRMGNLAFRYDPSSRFDSMLPTMHVNVSMGEAVAEELLKNVVPYIGGISAVHTWLSDETGFRFVNGDRDNLWRQALAGDFSLSLPPAEALEVVQQLKSSFVALNDSEQAMLRRYAKPYTYVTLEAGDSDIRVGVLPSFLLLPHSKVGEFWRWILDSIAPDEEAIAALTVSMKELYGITVEGRPPMKPDGFHAFLRELGIVLSRKYREKSPLTLRFVGHENNSFMLEVVSRNTVLLTMPADMPATTVAYRIRQLPLLE